MALDTSNYWKLVEGRETVRYYRRLTTSTFADPVGVPNAKRRAAARDETEAAALLGKTALVFHVWKNQLSGSLIAPKVKDKLTDGDGVTWTVLKVDVQSFGNRYRLACIEERGQPATQPQ